MKKLDMSPLFFVFWLILGIVFYIAAYQQGGDFIIGCLVWSAFSILIKFKW